MSSDNEITVDGLRDVVPKSMRRSVTKELVDTINSIGNDEVFRESYKDNLLTYSRVLGDGKYKLKNYIEAVKYVSYKAMSYSNEEAYALTFPDRYKKLREDGRSDKDISSYVAMYNGNKLVQLITEQSLIPVYILNAEVYQRAINVQADLMMNANSEKVRSDAANSILNHLKPPESTKIELDIGVKEDSSIEELRNATMELVKAQKLMIESGVNTASDIAHSAIVIEGERVD